MAETAIDLQRSSAEPVIAGKSRGLWRLVDGISAVERRVPDRMRAWKWLLLLPALLVVSTLAVGLIELAVRSFLVHDPFGDTEGGFTFDNYVRLFAGPTSDYYVGVFLRTFAMAALTAVTATLAGMCVAYLIVRSRLMWVRGLCILLALVPFLMGEVVRALGWLTLLGRDGFLAWAAGLVGLPFPQLIGTLLGVWIGLMQVMVPVAAFVMIPALGRLHPELEYAASTLGASPLRVWLHVSLPLLRPGLVASAAVVFALTMAQFAIPDVLGAGVTPFAANVIEQIFFARGNSHMGGAAAMVMLIIVVVVVGLLLSLVVERKLVRRG